MFRIITPCLFLFFSLLRISTPADITKEALIQGVNEARLIVRSGEIHARLIEMRGNVMSDAEIATWKNKRTEEWLQLFKQLSHGAPQDDTIKAFRENYLTPSVEFHAKESQQHPLRQHVALCFQILPPAPEITTNVYQYKMSIQKVDGLSLDSENAPFAYDSDFFLLSYDAQKQVKQEIGNVLFTATPRHATQLFTGDNYYGYWSPEYCGKAPQNVPSDAKLEGKEHIDNAECYRLAYTTPDGRDIKIWVDVAKDFAIRRYQITHPPNALFKHSQADYKAFRRFGDVWYPTQSQFAIAKEGDTLQTQRTIEVIDAEFNVDFPKDFFNIDGDFYRQQMPRRS